MKILRIPSIQINKGLYIVTNVFVSTIGFIRSFVFMKGLDLYELGIITIIQTIILLLSMSQFGLINGGYRVLALNIAKQNEKVNNLLFSFLGILTAFLFLLWGSTLFFNFRISHSLLIVTFIIGVLTLIVTWLTNSLVAKQQLAELNKLNLISSLFALCSLPLAFLWGVQGAVMVLFVQPTVFVVVCLAKNKDLRPTFFTLDNQLIKYVLRFGFIPFIAGIFTLVNVQIERWSILEILGTEALGRFYLVFLFSTLFVLIPTSLLNLFFPQCVKLYEGSDVIQFKTQIRKHFILLSTYLIIAILGSVTLLKPFIAFFLPMHVENVEYVYYYLPGLIALGLCDTFALIFNSVVRLKPILWAGGTSVLINLGLIYFSHRMNIFTLSTMSIIKSLNCIYIFVFYVISLFVLRRKIFNKL